MNDPNLPPEPSNVQLTRMEGTINLIAFQVTDHGQRLVQVEKDVGTLQLGHHQLASDAESRVREVTAAALAMRESKSDEDAAAQREVFKSNKTWTPVSRTLIVVTAVTAFTGICLNYLQAFGLLDK